MRHRVGRFEMALSGDYLIARDDFAQEHVPLCAQPAHSWQPFPELQATLPPLRFGEGF
jgi:hypothetical protein